MSEEISRLLVRVEANATQFEAAIKKLNRSLHGAQAETRKTMASIQRSVDGAAMGIRRSAMMASSALATIGVSFGAAKLVQDFREGEEAAKRLEAVLKTTGHAAGLSYGQIASWARELEEETGRSATEIQNAAAQLATFTSIGQREFTEAIEVANDMAAVFGGDLKSNLDAVARALDDPIEGFANLRKRGFALTEAELKRAEAHMKAGRFAAAQQVVLKNLSSQVDGAAKAVNTGLTKALNDLQRQAGDTFKEMADQGGTAAAVAALELATKSAAFLGENMGVVLKAAQALALFLATRYVAGVGLATAATLANAVATMRAKTAVETLTAALAKNPYGIAALAIAGLVTGLKVLSDRYSEAAVLQREQKASTEGTSKAIDAYREAAMKAANATGEHAKEARANAEAMRIEAIQTLRSAEALRVRRLALLAQRQVEAQSEADDIRRSVGPGQTTLNQGQYALAQHRVKVAKEAYEAAASEEAAALQAFRQLEQDIRDGSLAGKTTPLEYTDKDAGKNAKAAEQRKRLLEDLKAQTALEVAQLDEQVAKIRELERQAEITARIRQLEDAGFKAAQARAISGEVQTKLDEARARAMEREEGLLKRGWDLDIARLDENWETVRAIEAEVEKRELVAALAKVTADETSAIAKAESMLAAIQSARVDAAKRGLDLAREEHRLAVAQLSGNRQLTKELQDQAAIRERTKAYQAEGYGLKPDEAKQRATEEVTRERAAATYGEHRELFATAFSDGIRAAMTGDLQGFLSNQFGNFADTMMQRAGEQIFDSIFGGVDAVATGTAEGAAHAAVVGPAIVTAGAAAGTAMAASIVTAGAAAGAAMAAQIMAASAATSFLPGFSDGGYTGPGGVNQPKGVVHAGEVVWSQRDVARAGGVAVVEAMRRGMPGYAKGGAVGSTLLPQVASAMARGEGAGRQPIVVEQHLHNHFEGAVMTEDLLRDMDRKAAMAQAGAVAQVASASAEQQRKSMYRTRRS